jgi:hypothetical protein
MAAMTEDAAEQALQRALDTFGAELPANDKETMRKAFVDGRLDFDPSDESFTVLLRKPVELHNGETVETLRLEEPSAGQLRQATKAKDDFEQTLRLISLLSGHPVTVIESMRSRDLTLAGGVLSFFV